MRIQGSAFNKLRGGKVEQQDATQGFFQEAFGAKRSETWVFYWASETLTPNVSAVVSFSPSPQPSPAVGRGSKPKAPVFLCVLCLPCLP